MKMNQVTSLRVIRLIMALAMFWLFIGDLVILHQSRIFGHDFFDQHHHPFNKPGKSDDGKTFQKYHKSADKSDDGHADALLPSQLGISALSSSWLFVVYADLSFQPLNLLFLSGAGLRAPPTFS